MQFSDIIFLDLHMPRIDGKECLAELVADSQLRYDILWLNGKDLTKLAPSPTLSVELFNCKNVDKTGGN